MPIDPNAAALQSALGGEAPSMEEEGPGGEMPIDPQQLMQLLQLAQQSGDPKVMALLQQLIQLLGASGSAPEMEME